MYCIRAGLIKIRKILPSHPQRKVERQAKVLIKHLAIFFLLPSKKFLPISFKIQLLETSPQKQKEKRQKQVDTLFSDVFSLPVHFEFFAVFSYCLHFAKFVCLLKRLQRLKQEWQKSPARTRQTYGKTRFGLEKKRENYLPFFLLIILCLNSLIRIENLG